METTEEEYKEEGTIEAVFSEPDTQSWYDYIWKTEQETPKRLEDAAKFVAGIISVCMTIVIRGGNPTFKGLGEIGCMVIGLIVWLIALFFAFLVIYPHNYKRKQQSLESYKAMHQEIVKRKKDRLQASSFLFICGLVLLAIAFWRAGLQ